MTNQSEPKLTPEAVKLLNELAANRNSGLNLTTQGKESLETLVNEVLPDAIRAQRNGVAIHALICFALSAGSILYGVVNLMKEHRSLFDVGPGLGIMLLIPIALFLFGLRSWNIYRKMG